MLQSASKIVFLMITLTACVGFGLGRLEGKDFMVLAVAAFSYYFSIKTPGAGDSPTLSSINEEKKIEVAKAEATKEIEEAKAK